VSEAGDEKREGPLKKYHVEKSFADRRYKVSSARTYFYLNEASCERNMDIFIRCLEAAASESRILLSTDPTARSFSISDSALPFVRSSDCDQRWDRKD
jgi:proline dehydrogenase